MKTIKYIDLFAGVGGFRYGIENIRSAKQVICERSNSNNNIKNKLVEWKCLYSNEWNKYANQCYKKHYGECDNRDIRTVPTSDIPDHDLLCAGFPCQSFSIAGKRLGFEDTRGTMFFEIARIIRDKRPRYFLLENVKGLLSHDEGKTFQTILGVLSDLGYEYQWQVLNSKDFGVPQNRERVFIVGHSRGTPRPEVFPIIGEGGQDCKIYGRATGINGHDYLKRIYSDEGASPKLPTGTGGNHYAKIISKTIRVGGGKSPHGSKQNWDSYEFDGVIRRLTPVECERLQGFPDGWTDGFSDSQRYKMMGNAVTTNVITEIVKKLTS